MIFNWSLDFVTAKYAVLISQTIQISLTRIKTRNSLIFWLLSHKHKHNNLHFAQTGYTSCVPGMGKVQHHREVKISTCRIAHATWIWIIYQDRHSQWDSDEWQMDYSVSTEPNEVVSKLEGIILSYLMLKMHCWFLLYGGGTLWHSAGKWGRIFFFLSFFAYTIRFPSSFVLKPCRLWGIFNEIIIISQFHSILHCPFECWKL